MKTKKSWLLMLSTLLITSALMFLTQGTGTEATNCDYLDTLNAGAALIIDADLTMITEELAAYVASINGTAENESELITTGIVMANVKNVLNVREEPNEESERVGKLYADCGGTILARENGWTKLQSGNVIGWCNDEYLIFGEEAEQLAKEVGMMKATVITEGLRVRGEASSDGVLYGYLNLNDSVEVISDYNDGDEWVNVDYEGTSSYVSAEYVSVELLVDSGETMEEIEAREAAEAAEKAKLEANYGAYAADVSDLELLASLIYCEAGNQSYEGKLAVGAVVMNRVRSDTYPGTISGVIYASGQFSPAGSGWLAKVIARGTATQECYDAAQAALDGDTNVGTAMHFRRVGYREGIEIGAHVFW